MKIRAQLIVILVLVAGLVGVGLFFIVVPQLKHGDLVTVLSDELFGWKFPIAKFPITGPNQIAVSDLRTSGGEPQGLPVRLKIPAIGVDSAIEDAQITSDGRMDVPSGSVNVAWFALGPHPGQEGSAVIGGHFGVSKGVPFVFYKLDQLEVGDKVYSINDKGDTIAFVVRSIGLFDRNADATTVFTSDDGLAHLNLITCEGVWNRVNNNYPKRRVVFTDAVPAENILIRAVPIFHGSLAIGSRGPDVAALQTALEQKKLLRMPRGIAKGYFGVLTRTAVRTYQASVHVPQTGIFDGGVTRSKLFPES